MLSALRASRVKDENGGFSIVVENRLVVDVTKLRTDLNK